MLIYSIFFLIRFSLWKSSENFFLIPGAVKFHKHMPMARLFNFFFLELSTPKPLDERERGE